MQIRIAGLKQTGEELVFLTDPPVNGDTYTYRWEIERMTSPGNPVFAHESTDPHTTWRPTASGPYLIRVSATPHTTEQRTPTGSAVQASTSGGAALDQADLEFSVKPANADWRSIKRNVDAKFDALTQEVGNIADKLPPPGQPIEVALQKQGEILTADVRTLAAFFGAIRNRAGAISFSRYNEFVNRLLCAGTDASYAACRGAGEPPEFGSPGAASPSDGTLQMDYRRTAGDYGAPSIDERRADLLGRPSIFGVDAYQLLKIATQAFLVFEAGIVIAAPKDAATGRHGYRDSNGNFIAAVGTDEIAGESSRLPSSAAVTFDDVAQRLDQYLGRGSTTGTTYLRRIVDQLIGLEPSRRAERLPYCDGILRNRFSCPSMIELIWSYWQEEGMLVQTLNVIALRFQNRRGSLDRDPLAHLEIDPLRPLNNLLWGYVQDEMNRLTVPRRAYEYDHHYGLTTYGKAVPTLRAADSRSKFLAAFHNLLHRATMFYHDDADTTVIADAFPLLNALREVHLLLAEGAHNQFGDLPWTARAEMLVQQWLLARPEIREFLRGRAMVPYAGPWMGQGDTMKRLQGWSEVTITNFHELAVFGEQILLSIRYHDWNAVTLEDEAKLWARYWKAEIQRYIHAYRAVTGVDLATEPVDATAPWVHLRSRLAEEQRKRVGRQ